MVVSTAARRALGVRAVGVMAAAVLGVGAAGCSTSSASGDAAAGSGDRSVSTSTGQSGAASDAQPSGSGLGAGNGDAGGGQGGDGRDVSVYVTPHQDDETLSMGEAIARDAAAGKRVYIVLATTGSSAGDLRLVNQRLAATGGAGGAPSSLTAQQYTQARDRELVAAAARLGVPADRVSFLGHPEGSITPAIAAQIWRDLIGRFGPAATYGSMSWFDVQPMHVRLAYALRDACLAQPQLRCQFFEGARYQVGTNDIPKALPVATPTGEWVTGSDDAVRAAAKEYGVWDPAQGRYAIGAGSVRWLFAHLEANPRDWVHGVDRPASWPSAQAEAAARDWLQSQQTPAMRGQ